MLFRSRRFLTALGGEHPGGYGPGSGRLELAEQLLANENPFPSRVLVNRVWHHLMGRGMVPTVDNFGVLGQAPQNPELLDWTADHFRSAQHWSVKQFTRSIMLSSTYRMSSEPHPQAAAADPANELWHHMPIRRLEAEPIRDSILAISGQWNRSVLGPPVEVFLTPFMDGRGRPGGSGPLDGNGRRSIYTKIRRNFLSPMMLAFDSPIPFATVGRRTISNVPAQALILLNDPYLCKGSISHNNDWLVIVPIFHDGKLIGWVGGVTHVIDTGAVTPGSMSTGQTQRFGDGYMITCRKTGVNDTDRKSTRLNSSHIPLSRMPSSA